FAILIASTIAIKSYLFVKKLHMKNIKTSSYILDILFLIWTVILCFISNEKELMPIYDKKLIWAYIFIMIIIDFTSLYEWLYYKNVGIDRNLIKDTIDNSVSGILVLKNKDKIMFQNMVMYELIGKLGITDNYIKNIKAASSNRIGKEYMALVDDNAWLFNISRDGLEVTATDINEEYVLNQKLEKQNELINQNNEELEWTIENLEELEKEEQTLKVKNKFHDLLGQNLSVLQAYLNQDMKYIEDEKRFAEIKFMIKGMFSDFEDSEDSKANLDNLVRINNNIGISVRVDGELPADKEKAKVFFEIIREAVTNAVRHADSNVIDIRLDNNADGTSMIITNNGSKPKPIISESEGIRGMRRKVKSINGTFSVTTEPEFIIKVSA
ncbi:MAG: hypothetical protein IJ167_04405, partial [Lachnospiraceae bacterium]|nr:hypothetical protein [Lachnospiraceae bacterium]